MRLARRISVAIAVALMVAAGCARSGTGSPAPSGDAQQAASNALATLQKLVNERNYKGLGFVSLDEVKSATLAPPLVLYNVGLDRLKSYQPGQDPNSLLTASSETIYPVSVAGQVRSSVTVVKRETGYTTASFGNAAIVKDLSRYRHPDQPSEFAVRVPTLSMYFLGNRVENRLMLTPVSMDSRLPLRPGAAVPAENVITAIVPLAQAYNGLPM